MFSELMPLIQHRPLTLTVAAIDDKQIQVNVIPNQTKKDSAANEKIGHAHKKEVAPIPDSALAALTTPLCLTGTAEEIDAKLAETLQQFTAAHIGLQNHVNTAVAEIQKAVQAIDERERLKKEEERKNKKVSSAAKPDDAKPGKATTEKAEEAEEESLPSLFTAQPAAVSANNPATAKSTENPPAPGSGAAKNEGEK